MKNNPWILKEKEELEKKLSIEISRNFSISESLAKKLIYETHLSLDNLKKEILKEQNKSKEKSEKINIDNEKLEKLLAILKWAKETIKSLSSKDLDKLKNIINNKKDLSKEHKIIQKIFSQKLIEKAKNPTQIEEHILWASLWILNSTIVILEWFYLIWIGFLKTPSDLLSILKWEAEIDSFKKI